MTLPKDLPYDEHARLTDLLSLYNLMLNWKGKAKVYDRGNNHYLVEITEPYITYTTPTQRWRFYLTPPGEYNYRYK